MRFLVALALAGCGVRSAPKVAAAPVRSPPVAAALKAPPPTLQLRFASPDGASALVIDPSPDFDDLKLGGLWRDGRQIATFTPASLRLPPAATRIEAGKFRWLSAEPPRASADGVELRLLDGSRLLLRFDGRGLEALPSQPVKVQPKAEVCSPCAYTDGQGVYHVVETASEIPPQFRSQAGRIRGDVQHADAAPPPPPEPEFEPVHVSPPPRFVNPPAQQQRPRDSTRNELGENFIEYTRRLTMPPKTDLDAKCIDNSGEWVPCSETGVQPHQ